MDVHGITHICDILRLGYSHPRDGTEERGPHINISCPLAGPPNRRHKDPYDSNNSCSVKIVDDGPSLVKCFSGACGFKGTWLYMLQLALRDNKDPAMQAMLEDAAKTEALTLEAIVERNRKEIERLTQRDLYHELDKDVLPEARWDDYRNKVPRYAFERGIRLETCRRWGLGYDVYGKRLVFPVRRRDGKLVGMQGRDVTGQAGRPHHNYEGFKKDHYILGAHLLEDGKPIVVVEGAVGVVKTDQALYPLACCVAPLGEGFSKFHSDTIADANPSCVYIFTDGDAPGRAIASKIEYQLHGRVPMKLMECPTDVDEMGKKLFDPGNLPEAHIQYLFRNAKPVLDMIRWTLPLPSPA